MLNRSRGNNSNSSGGGSNEPTVRTFTHNPCLTADDIDHLNHDDEDLNFDHGATSHNLLDERIDHSLSTPTSTPSQQNNPSSPTINLPPSNHLTGPRLQMFNRIASRANLDKDHMTLGRQLCNVTTGEDQFYTCIVTMLSIRQEVNSTREDLLAEIGVNPSTRLGTSPEVCTWKADGTELKQSMRLIATQCILGGDVQAYTARVDTMGEPDLLPLSLYAKVITGCHANVPVLDTVIVKLYQRERGLIGGRVRVREEILQDVDQLRTSRYAWLRMQAIHWGLNLAEYEGRSFWNVVDRQLEFLRTQTIRYRYAFFLLALQFDVERIDGTKNFTQLKQTTDFSLPTEVQIRATMAELDETFGQEVPPDEEAYDSVTDETT
ncbi:hypothetical protein DFH28DRAFT_1080241 [Melampsora americana]|nr:hypothetical protein DFH28DRAFT_1080241 [Melampsora americana]